MRRLTATLALLALLAAPVHAGCLGRLIGRVLHPRRCQATPVAVYRAPAVLAPTCGPAGCRVR